MPEATPTPEPKPEGNIALAPGQNPETGRIDGTGAFQMPEKFEGKSAEDIAQAYLELEKLKNEPKPEPGEDGTPQITDEAAKALEVAGLDMADFSTEYEKDGKLSEESFKKLADAGFNRDIVNTFLAGRVAQATEEFQYAQTQIDEMHNALGGKDDYGKVIEWANTNLEPTEIDAFNKAIDEGRMDDVLVAAKGLRARYVVEFGTEPKLLGGQGTGSADDTFASSAQVTAAMKDPRYNTDPAYRAEVARRLKHSKAFG